MTTSFSVSAILQGAEVSVDENWSFLPGTESYYRGLVERLSGNSLDVTVVHYDWTRPMTENVKHIQHAVDNILARTGAQKVDIVAHSMGGLLARELIQARESENVVDHLITLGTPHKGAADSYVAYEGGEIPDRWHPLLQHYIALVDRTRNTVGLALSDPPVSFRTNFPSLRDLIPTENFLVANGTKIDVDELHPSTQNLHWKYRNETLADDLERTGVTLTTIASTNVATLATIPIKSTERSFWDRLLERWRDGRPLVVPPVADTEAGDQTVPLASARLDNTEPFTGVAHTDLPEKAQEEVIRILTGEEPSGAHIAYDVPESVLGTTVLSPVMPMITGPNGKVLSSDQNDFGEKGFFNWNPNNPNGPKMLTILDPEPGKYTHEYVGTGEGDYTLIMSYADQSETTTTTDTGTTYTGEKFSEVVTVTEETSTLIDDEDYKALLQRIADIAEQAVTNGAIKRSYGTRIQRYAETALRSLEQYEQVAGTNRGWSANWRLRSYHKRLTLIDHMLSRSDKQGTNEDVTEMRRLLEKVQQYSPPIEHSTYWRRDKRD